MPWFKSEVSVTFIDDATGESFAVTKISPKELPETFEVDTTLHLGNEDWNVVEANPKTRAEFAKSKKLILRLRRVETVDPGAILFSLPTICDLIPPAGTAKNSGTELELAEDDWRQIEFVSHELATIVDSELSKIRLIHENAREESGWREIHVRKQPDQPLSCNLTLAELANELDFTATSTGVSYYGSSTQIVDGYSLHTSEGFTIYGTAPQGKIQTLAIAASENLTSLQSLKSMAQKYQLDFVDWCRCTRTVAEDLLFES